MSEFKKIICVDFDGVIHSYISGWQGADVVSDPPVDGAIQWLKAMMDHGFDVCIYSSRSKEDGGIKAMQYWLSMNRMEPYYRNRIQFPTEKPSAWLTIDDRAICFTGTFPTMQEMDEFKPWNKK
jgi:hypothetical protein